MQNFYRDNRDILFHMENMNFKEIIKLRENDFAERKLFAEAPRDDDDAIDNYHRILELVGEIAAEYISPNAAEVDEQGATLEEGQVILAGATQEAVKRLRESDLMGFTLPRKYGGLNFPKTIYSIAIELISRADASLMNLFGLQEISETILKYGTDEQKEKYLYRFSSGEASGAMALTEPEAGSDLPAIKLKASQDEDGQWRLNGVKRFITNGGADISLILARSESDVEDARGLSLFIYEYDQNRKVRRLEDKFGIHGSPTCELQFTDAKVELLGQRKRGLIKYTMSLMNGARLGVAAQALGISEAAYREAKSYAEKRVQFGKSIDSFPPVYEMLIDMKVNIEAMRSLLYEASQVVDLKEGIEAWIEKHPEEKAELKKELKYYSQLEQLLTPMLKCFSTEVGNKVCYDAMQVHGGVGYTKDFNIERYCRDIRVTNIYEGTTQMQVVAAVGGLLKGALFSYLNEYENSFNFTSVQELFEMSKGFRTRLERAVEHINDRENATYQDFHARRLVDMAAYTTISYLLSVSAKKSKHKRKVAETFIAKTKYKMESNLKYILSNDETLIQYKRELLGD